MNVAVKVLKRDGLTPAIRRQFVEEANTMAQLADHPYIVQVFRSEQTPDGGAYLVMKYYPAQPGGACQAGAVRRRGGPAPASTWRAPSRPPIGPASSTVTSSRPTS